MPFYIILCNDLFLCLLFSIFFIREEPHLSILEMGHVPHCISLLSAVLDMRE